ncbi:hypothetical protein F5Y14DRAFT_164761 [Nemania sp. NC0429]|nr:hypothetical protein F5Y14DRAFT_164761 [Nemania sp. NC0429]
MSSSSSSSSSSPLNWLLWPPAVVSLLLLYVPFSAAIRRHQLRVRARRHGSLANMTLDEAYAIKSRMAEREFPMAFSAALGSVFFKAEGVPSIAKLVYGAVQRSSSSSSSSPEKPRPGVTATPASLLGCPGAPGTWAAVDRVNYIHSLYRPSGKMSDDDLLYVLGLFALEPLRFIERWEWRAPTLEERCALATLWRALGKDLEIPFHRLPSSCAAGSTSGFRDALHWLAELEVWGREYEARHRAPTAESARLGEMQLDAWVRGVPVCFRGIARGFVAALIEPGLRDAMGIQAPSALSVFIVETVTRARSFVRGYFYSPVALVRGYL